MEPGKWYKSSDIMSLLGIKTTRTKELLHILITNGDIENDKTTKGKRYRKADKKG